MTQEEYTKIKEEFFVLCDLVRLDAYAATGYEWMVVPKTGGNRTMAAQHALFIQPTDGIDNDHDGKIDEADECVTKADAGQGPHNYNLARDIVPMVHQGVIWWEAPKHLWRTMANLAQGHGLVAGYYFEHMFDAPHIEHPRFREVRAAYRAGEIHVE